MYYLIKKIPNVKHPLHFSYFKTWKGGFILVWL